MNRRKFIQSSILGATAFFLPNTVLAAKTESSFRKLAKKTLFTQPDLKDYKFNTDGTAFFKTRIGFQTVSSNQVFLPGEFWVTHDENGYGTPTLYFDGNNYHIFVSQLFLDYKMNGFVYKYNEKEGFTHEQIYQHENMGWYAFWGKAINGQPALYHYQYTNCLMHQSTIENGFWVTNTIYNTPPQGAIELYNSQLNHVDYNTQANQFGFEYQVHPDGFYDFLKLKDNWEKGLLRKEKDLAELNERKNPTLLSSLENPLITRTIRNKQFLANSSCDCSDETEPNPKNICLVKTYDLHKNNSADNNVELVYPTRLAFYDDRNVRHEIPEILYCSEDALGQQKPVLFSDGHNYFVHINSFEKGIEQSFLYQYNEKDGWHKEKVSHIENLGKADFTAQAQKENPIIYTNQLPTLERNTNFIKVGYDKSSSRLSESVLIINRILSEQNDVTNPFVPIYCEGDDTSRAITKPNIIYKEVLGTKIEIPNMPRVKTQDSLGECRAFSLAVIFQKYICDKSKTTITDCQNPPSDKAISYFGMLSYTNQTRDTNKTFVRNQDGSRGMYQIINQLSEIGNKLILDSCKPFEKLIENFTNNGIVYPEHEKKRDNFFAYLKKIYETQKSTDMASIKDCQSCVDEINRQSGLNATLERLKEALTHKTFEEFLYELFFNDCKRKSFPFGNTSYAYPTDADNVTPVEVKNKIIEGLKLGRPILFPHICLSDDNNGDCSNVHSVVLSGYKQVTHPKDKEIIKELFKVHNSWGEDWQRINNNGWCDADTITQHTGKIRLDGKIRIVAQSVLWLTP